MSFDYFAVRLDGPDAAGKKIGLNIEFIDLGKQYGLAVENAVLNYGKPLAQPDATLTLSKATFLVQHRDALRTHRTANALRSRGMRSVFQLMVVPVLPELIKGSLSDPASLSFGL